MGSLVNNKFVSNDKAAHRGRIFLIDTIASRLQFG